MKSLAAGTLMMILILSAEGSTAQVTTVDIVKVKTQFKKEALFFYEHNWKVFREQALEKKYISGFELLKTKEDTTGVFAIVLITRYGDNVTYSNSEKNFRGIIETSSPNGPKMLNSVTRKEFILSVTGYSGDVIQSR